ncbi:hypothetical protein D0Y65_004071 [Glycine soja]|uniref:Secreted protein n=1 Tax=Glycine soja TaxID=3848 RepID=A0A445LPM1_GLYSO|nr:hypothetical protein D0Y65_004071 [Glycine soja]
MAATIAMAVVTIMAGWRKMAGFAWFLSAVGVGPTRPNPTRLCIQLNVVPRRTSPLRPSLTSASFPHPVAPSRRRDRRHPHSPRTQPPPPATPLHEDEGQLRASPGNAASRDRDASSFCLVKKTKKTKTQTRVSQP